MKRLLYWLGAENVMQVHPCVTVSSRMDVHTGTKPLTRRVFFITSDHDIRESERNEMLSIDGVPEMGAPHPNTKDLCVVSREVEFITNSNREARIVVQYAAMESSYIADIKNISRYDD